LSEGGDAVTLEHRRTITGVGRIVFLPQQDIGGDMFNFQQRRTVSGVGRIPYILAYKSRNLFKFQGAKVTLSTYTRAAKAHRQRVAGVFYGRATV
jgi:hypothetical protein